MNRYIQTPRDKGVVATAGFTLVEIMVVIVILGILATIVGTNVLGSSEKAKISAAKMEVKSILEQVNLYMIENSGGVPQWEDMIRADARGHKYIELDAPKLDPWNHEYIITTDIDFPNKPFIHSWGPDGMPDTDDDITNKTITSRDDK